tara:strand:+ start:2090 stop:2356 length:267 start_codon:yes stop_codon:yes gene_type:complete
MKRSIKSNYKMTYYILLEGDSDKELWDNNTLGEESFGSFYTGNGFLALNKIVNTQPELLDSLRIFDEKKTSYTIEEFLNLIKKWKIIT